MIEIDYTPELSFFFIRRKDTLEYYCYWEKAKSRQWQSRPQPYRKDSVIGYYNKLKAAHELDKNAPDVELVHMQCVIDDVKTLEPIGDPKYVLASKAKKAVIASFGKHKIYGKKAAETAYHVIIRHYTNEKFLVIPEDYARTRSCSFDAASPSISGGRRIK